MATPVYPQRFEPNYDEASVPVYTLPEILTGSDGEAVVSSEQWEETRRPEIYELFQQHVYGQPIPDGITVSFSEAETGSAFDGQAVRKQIKIVCERNGKTVELLLLVYLPARAEKSAPMFVGLNFAGNHTICSDDEILLSNGWYKNDEEKGITENRASDQTRGTRSSRWAVMKLIESGFGLATMYYGDIDPDFDDGFRNGIHSLFDESELNVDEMTSITAWSWGLSRIVDYFETDEAIDHSRIALMGHSRLGKTSLWAGANDTRFGIVISNNSGCGGAALSRRAFGETVERINTVFPHWFCKRFSDYNRNEDACPVDQHMLLALIAPRPVYVASAVEDRWADPYGEFLSVIHAVPAYEVYGLGLNGLEGVSTEELPELDQPVGSYIGYHIRSGGHDVKDFDWSCYIRFAENHFVR
ncbi:MAG: acetylxylan esterase [Planctomycetota bacterium]